MNDDPLAYVVPVFLVLIASESLFSFFQRDGAYDLGDTVTNLGCGLIQFLILALARGWTTFIYTHIYINFNILLIPDRSALGWSLSIVGVDLGYYWFHRMGHRINFFWALHSPITKASATTSRYR